MCGRFYIESDDTPEELIDLLNRAESKAQRSGLQLRRGEICPGDCAAVLAVNRGGEPSAFPMRWGFTMDKRLLINARCETAQEKPVFRDGIRNRRCLIPASAYFEWDHRVRPSPKYRFSIPEAPFLYLAGLYRYEEGCTWPVFTVLTRDAAPEVACFHDRMPVIIPGNLTGAWLDRDQAAQPLLDTAVTQLTWQREPGSAEQLSMLT